MRHRNEFIISYTFEEAKVGCTKHLFWRVRLVYVAAHPLKRRVGFWGGEARRNHCNRGRGGVVVRGKGGVVERERHFDREKELPGARTLEATGRRKNRLLVEQRQKKEGGRRERRPTARGAAARKKRNNETTTCTTVKTTLCITAEGRFSARRREETAGN